MLQLYFIKYNLAGITEHSLVLRGSDIWISYPRNLTQVRCHSWKKWLYLLCGEELVTWEQPRPICFLCKTYILCHSLRVYLTNCLLPNLSSKYFFSASLNPADFSEPNLQTSWLHPSPQLFLLLVPLRISIFVSSLKESVVCPLSFLNWVLFFSFNSTFPKEQVFLKTWVSLIHLHTTFIWAGKQNCGIFPVTIALYSFFFVVGKFEVRQPIVRTQNEKSICFTIKKHDIRQVQNQYYK